MIKIECTKHEKKIILIALEDWCPFKQGTIQDCNEDSDCNDCKEKNIKFTVMEGM